MSSIIEFNQHSWPYRINWPRPLYVSKWIPESEKFADGNRHGAQVVGYMGVPYYGGDMVSHPQFLTVRNERGAEMLDLVRPRLHVIPTMSAGSRSQFVMQTVEADDK